MGADPGTTAQGRELRALVPLVSEVMGGVARRTRARLTTRAGSDVMVALGTVEPTDLKGLVDGASEWTVWSMFSVGGQLHPAFVHIEPGLLRWITARLLGGSDEADADAPIKAPSALQRSFGGRLAAEIMETVERHWSVPPAPRFTAERVGRAPVQVDGDNSPPMLTALLAFGDDGRAGNLGISLPAPALRGLLPTAAAARGSARPRTPSYDRVLPIEVELVVELARLPITIGTLNGLSVGAEIPMGNLAEVIARVDNRPTFAGEAGTSNGLRSLRVERRLDFSSTTGMRDR